MNFDVIISSIATVGFPAAMCILMHMDNKEVRKDHKEEVTALATAIENNTVVMTRVVDKLEEMEDRV